MCVCLFLFFLSLFSARERSSSSVVAFSLLTCLTGLARNQVEAHGFKEKARDVNTKMRSRMRRWRTLLIIVSVIVLAVTGGIIFAIIPK